MGRDTGRDTGGGDTGGGGDSPGSDVRPQTTMDVAVGCPSIGP